MVTPSGFGASSARQSRDQAARLSITTSLKLLESIGKTQAKVIKSFVRVSQTAITDMVKHN